MSPLVSNPGVEDVLPGTDVSITGSAVRPVVNAGALLTSSGAGVVGGPGFIPASATQAGNAGLGASDYTPATDYPVGDDDRAYEMMIKFFSAANGDYTLLALGHVGFGGHDEISYRPIDGRKLSMVNGGSFVALPDQLFDGHPHHLVLSYSAPTWSAYVDGAFIGTFNDGGRATPASGNVAIKLGGVPSDGAFQNVAIYRHQLTLAQVAAHWANRANQTHYAAAVTTDTPSTFWQLGDQPGRPSFVDTMGVLDFGIADATLGTMSLFATDIIPPGAPLTVPKLSPTSPFFDGQKPVRAFNTDIINGARRRTVAVSVDLNPGNGTAHAGFVSVIGQEAIAVADMVGIPVGTPGGTYRHSFTFQVDPGAIYQITDDITGTGTAVLIAVVETDW